jgi:hypothetical protein
MLLIPTRMAGANLAGSHPRSQVKLAQKAEAREPISNGIVIASSIR